MLVDIKLSLTEPDVSYDMSLRYAFFLRGLEYSLIFSFQTSQYLDSFLSFRTMLGVPSSVFLAFNWNIPRLLSLSVSH